MIFVTVGTHEQQFNRLLKEIDLLKKAEIIKDNVFMQIGYSDYKPKHSQFQKFLSYEEMEEYIKKADIVVTHGGASTFMNSIKKGKKTIIVPRLRKFNEHVNNHQKIFLDNIGFNYIDDINNLRNAIENASQFKYPIKLNNEVFCSKLRGEIFND